MKKQVFKSLINQLNEYSLETHHLERIIPKISQTKENGIQIKEQDIYDGLDFLREMKLVHETKNCFNLYPCCIVYAKSAGHTQLESLALFEMGLHFDDSLMKEDSIHLSKFPSFYHQLIKDSSLLENESISTENRAYTDEIIEQYNYSIISETLSVLFTDYIIDRSGPIEYKNTKEKMEDFPHKEWILEIMPQRGIPTNRDVSKNLQVFYKDTLMHEFNKTCPICGCHLPKMLIGSHIKPFRDCAHLYEAACHDNGLLLCRNHDFLFDQGYISFNDDGKAIIHNSIAMEKDLYQIQDLDTKYMSNQRKLFLAYHRKHIFKKNEE